MRICWGVLPKGAREALELLAPVSTHPVSIRSVGSSGRLGTRGRQGWYKAIISREHSIYSFQEGVAWLLLVLLVA